MAAQQHDVELYGDEESPVDDRIVRMATALMNDNFALRDAIASLREEIAQVAVKPKPAVTRKRTIDTKLETAGDNVDLALAPLTYYQALRCLREARKRLK